MSTVAPTTILALHYWAGAGHEFDAVRALLPSETRFMAPDLPGFGQQPAPDGFDYSVAVYTDWVANFIAENQLTDYTLIGHSMGGKIALALAARRPAGLRRLVLLSPSPPTAEPISDENRADSLAAWGKPAEAEKTYAKIVKIALAEEQHQQVVADNLRATQAAWDAWLQHGSREDISAQMPQIAVPCHLVVGALDEAIPLAAQPQQTLPLLPPGTPLTVVPSAGHLLPLEAPAAVVAALVG